MPSTGFKFLRRVLGVLICIGTLLFFAQLAFARAGGGEGYHGGGGGGGFGGGGGGGNGGGNITDVIYLIYFIVRYPQFSLPIIGLLVIFGYFGSKNATSAYTGSVIRKGRASMDAASRERAVNEIKQRDPAFDEEDFYRRVGLAFYKLQQAWSAQDLSSVRAFISDGVFERFSIQFAEQRQSGWRNQMDDVRIRSITMAAVGSDEFFDQVSLRIAASAIDYRVALQDGHRVGGSMLPESFVEYWSFLRRRGATTQLQKAGLIEGNCPNCGSAIEMNQSAKCANCGAILRSGEYDWVLTEITQACEWCVEDEREIPGLAALREGDPQLNVQHLEDLASVIFWRRTMADRTGDVRHLRKLATVDFCERYAKGIAEMEGRAFYGDCAVGAVRTLGLIGGEEYDRAVIEVRWSGSRFIVRKGQPQRTDHRALSQSLFVLIRRHGVSSDVGKAISSAHCPGCGAPESDLSADVCEFCGQILNDPSNGWVLSDIQISASAEGRALLDDLSSSVSVAGDQSPVATAVAAPAAVVVLSAPSARGLLAWMIDVMLADGQIDPRERETLAQVAAARQVPQPEVDHMIAAAQAGQLRAPQPADLDEARVWLAGMIKVALADGNIDKREAAMIREVAARVGLVDYDVRSLIKQQRAELYTAAKQHLRQKRAG